MYKYNCENVFVFFFFLIFFTSCKSSKEITEKNIQFLKVNSKCLFEGFERDTYKYKKCIKDNMAK